MKSKNPLLIVLMIAQIAVNQSYAQMNDGQYTFGNSEVTLVMTLANYGTEISRATLTNNVTKEASSGTGYYRSANGIEWYEFQTSGCNYEFDIPNGTLRLNQFDCSNGQQSQTYTLSKQGSNWLGTFKNSNGCILVISNLTEGVGFDYQLTCGAYPGCEGLDFSGTATITSSSKATGGFDEYDPMQFELQGEKIYFSPSLEMTGMNCSDNFDSEFLRQ